MRAFTLHAVNKNYTYRHRRRRGTYGAGKILLLFYQTREQKAKTHTSSGARAGFDQEAQE